jgi:hypothetical protein
MAPVAQPQHFPPPVRESNFVPVIGLLPINQVTLAHAPELHLAATCAHGCWDDWFPGHSGVDVGPDGEGA